MSIDKKVFDCRAREEGYTFQLSNYVSKFITISSNSILEVLRFTASART